MRARGWLRAGLALVALAEFGTGAWQLLFPRSFFDLYWVSLLPPYNEHLMRDQGALNLAMAVVFAGSAIALQRRLVYTALAAFTVWMVSHFVFHATHLAHFPSGHAAAQTVTLGLAVLVPLALLPLARAGTPST